MQLVPYLIILTNKFMSKKIIPPQSDSQQQQDLTPKIYLAYRKKCDQNGIPVSPFIKAKLQQATQSGALQQFQTSQPLGPNQARAFLDALFELKYSKLKVFSVWKAEFGDEGVRILSKYLMGDNNLEVIDLLDNGVTALGCQFLGKALINPQTNLMQIKLDNNLIGTQGLKNLSLGLRSIPTLDKLSLKYCNIDKHGARYIQQIIANIHSKLRSIKLQGNPLQNEGTYAVLRAIRTCGETIEKINIADLKMNLLDYTKQNDTTIEYKIGQEILAILKNNMLLVKFQCRFNQIHNQIAQQMLTMVQQSKNIKNMEFPNNVKYELRDALDTVIRARNKKPKKGKKVVKKK